MHHICMAWMSTHTDGTIGIYTLTGIFGKHSNGIVNLGIESVDDEVFKTLPIAQSSISYHL